MAFTPDKFEFGEIIIAIKGYLVVCYKNKWETYRVYFVKFRTHLYTTDLQVSFFQSSYPASYVLPS